MVRKVKKYIFNPVLRGPWLPKCHYFHNSSDIVLNLATGEEVRDLRVRKTGLRGPSPPKVSKSILTKFYTEQLSRRYPQLTKTQIKAALILNDNNLRETCVMLDIKDKFDILRRNPYLPLKKRQTIFGQTNVFSQDEISAFPKMLPKPRTPNPREEKPLKLGTFPKQGVLPVPKLESSTSTVTVSSCSTLASNVSDHGDQKVYDFSDSDLEPIPKWDVIRSELNESKLASKLSRNAPVRKIGVILIKQKSGYKSVLL